MVEPGPLRLAAENALVDWITETTPAGQYHARAAAVRILEALETFCKGVGAMGYSMDFALSTATGVIVRALADALRIARRR